MAASDKPFFTRRRVVAASALLVIALVVGLAVFGGGPKHAVGVTFHSFAVSTNGYFPVMIVTLTNRTSKNVVVPDTLRDEKMTSVHFGADRTNGLWWTVALPGDMSYVLKPHTAQNFKYALPAEGDVIRLRIRYQIPRRELPQWVSAKWRYKYVKLEDHFVICDAQIQCPTRAGDKIVGAPRLISAAGLKL